MPLRLKSLYRPLSLFTFTLMTAATSSLAIAAEAPTVDSVTPRGEVVRADLVRISFTQAVVSLGSEAVNPFLFNVSRVRSQVLVNGWMTVFGSMILSSPSVNPTVV